MTGHRTCRHEGVRAPTEPGAGSAPPVQSRAGRGWARTGQPAEGGLQPRARTNIGCGTLFRVPGRNDQTLTRPVVPSSHHVVEGQLEVGQAVVAGRWRGEPLDVPRRFVPDEPRRAASERKRSRVDAIGSQFAGEGRQRRVRQGRDAFRRDPGGPSAASAQDREGVGSDERPGAGARRVGGGVEPQGVGKVCQPREDRLGRWRIDDSGDGCRTRGTGQGNSRRMMADWPVVSSSSTSRHSRGRAASPRRSRSRSAIHSAINSAVVFGMSSTRTCPSGNT